IHSLFPPLPTSTFHPAPRRRAFVIALIGRDGALLISHLAFSHPTLIFGPYATHNMRLCFIRPGPAAHARRPFSRPPPGRHTRPPETPDHANRTGEPQRNRGPTCTRTADDNQRFCVIDGTPLIDDAPAPRAAVAVADGEPIQRIQCQWCQAMNEKTALN